MNKEDFEIKLSSYRHIMIAELTAVERVNALKVSGVGRTYQEAIDDALDQFQSLLVRIERRGAWDETDS